ncbi:MAG: DNA repair ATPase [Verrucomicrobiaceae bacterium]|nr:DNA repair ATPase [Verrucomicrobiaceae bacterium]
MSQPDSKLEAGAYEVIRQRLSKHAAELSTRLERLNTERKAIFGGIDLALISTSRLTTENNCVPRDMVAIGPSRFLFGYNVHLGLRSTMRIEDVFAVYDYQNSDHSFHHHKNGLLDDPAFAEDFAYIYKFYKNASFLKFHRLGPHLYMVMQAGRDVSEVKTFKWLVNDDAGTLKYLGNRFDHEFVFPPQHELEWKRARREMYREGEHSHVSIDDRVFVETIGGDLTVKVENNTDSGKGIYSEPVENRDQTLDDAEFWYAIAGSLVLLRVLPYQEKQYRHLLFNERTQEVHRIDSLGEACLLLPDDHGVLFTDGYALQTGAVKRLPTERKGMKFERRISSANGEDTLFVFHNVEQGEYQLLHYNLIAQDLSTPMFAHGYSLFANGEMLLVNGDPEPRKHHVVQSWRTPIVTESVANEAHSKSFLAQIGNADLVRAMAECRGVLTLLGKEDSFSGLYVDLARRTTDIADAYFWIDREEAHRIKEVLLEIKGAAESALAEFEKVRAMRRSAAAQTEQLKAKVDAAISMARSTQPDDILGYVKQLTTLRELRGQAIALKDVRYVDLDAAGVMDKTLSETADKVSEQCITFLLKPEALEPYKAQIGAQKARIGSIGKVTDADELASELDKAAGELEMLTSVVSGLKIKDATETTRIVESISELYAQLNQVRSLVRNKRSELARQEGAAEFQAQMSLLSQSVLNYLEACTSPEKCDEALTRVMVQVEEVEGKFSDFDEFVSEIANKREEIYSAFQGKRTSLVEARNKRCAALGQSAERILSGLRNKAAGFAKTEEVHAYLASDVMAAKLRDLIEELRGLGDGVRADELTTRLKTLREDALKQIRDKAELFADGGDLIQFGRHKFTVNRQPLELTMLLRDGALWFHLSGTRYFEKVESAELEPLKAVWEQNVISEDASVYRAEYLAWKFLQAHPDKQQVAVEEVRAFMHERYHEGYTKGVHDADGALILNALLPMHHSLGLLRHSSMARAEALVFWKGWADGPDKVAFAARMRARGKMKSAFGTGVDGVLPSLPGNIATAALRCLCDELMASATLPHTRSAAAVELVKAFKKTLVTKRSTADFNEVLSALADQPQTQFEIAYEWIKAAHPEAEDSLAQEAAALLLYDDAGAGVASTSKTELAGLTGSHSRITNGMLPLDYHEFTERLSRYESTTAAAFDRFSALKHELITKKRNALRLEQFKAGVLSSFVRNRLLDQVYLPIIGANLAKQIGAAGADTRTDRMGLLLLISPPGYGKTTLMEYVANRLGITMVKVNGPALGHQVTSLDPAEAPNASAREEVEKLNLAFEMGDNVMIYLDDIQHTHPEFLQKFIPLCDGTRKIEGVFKGQARTYDLRGRKVAVVMAGNPYTEIGGRFQVPDMLANRADTYNLGEILGGHQEAFKDSYIENTMTSNPVLARIAARSHADALSVLKIAQTGSREGIEYEGNYSAEEINDAAEVMKRLLQVRETILRVNEEYIRSAAQEDAYRTEPPFKLQGSYRNMNKIAEKIQPIMTEAEVQQLITDHYRSESQTLSKAAEANLLKWREITGQLDEAGDARWKEIRRTFGRNLLLGSSDDPVGKISGQLSALVEAVSKPTLSEQTVEHLKKIIEGLRAVPVNVDINVLPVERRDDDDVPVRTDTTVRQDI